MENQIIPKVAQVWRFDYFHIFITKVIPPNLRRNYPIIAFQYMDTSEDDEMSIQIFQKYCKLVNDV